MCGGGGKPPAAAAAPAITVPVPNPSASASATMPPIMTEAAIADKKQKQAAAYQNGLASTIKTSGAGDTSSVNLLSTSATAGGKTKLGQ